MSRGEGLNGEPGVEGRSDLSECFQLHIPAPFQTRDHRRAGVDFRRQLRPRHSSQKFVSRMLFGVQAGQDVKMSEASTTNGSVHVKVEVLHEGSADAANAGGPVETRLAGITPHLPSKIPRRVTDPNGRPGDIVRIRDFSLGCEAHWPRPLCFQITSRAASARFVATV